MKFSEEIQKILCNLHNDRACIANNYTDLDMLEGIKRGFEAGQKANAEDCKEWQLKQENIIRASERQKCEEEMKIHMEVACNWERQKTLDEVEMIIKPHLDFIQESETTYCDRQCWITIWNKISALRKGEKK